MKAQQHPANQIEQTCLVVEKLGGHDGSHGHKAVRGQAVHAQRAAQCAAAATLQARHVGKRGHEADGGALAVAQQARGVGIQADACGGAGRGAGGGSRGLSCLRMPTAWQGRFDGVQGRPLHTV